jgi:hypothetical protein
MARKQMVTDGCLGTGLGHLELCRAIDISAGGSHFDQPFGRTDGDLHLDHGGRVTFDGPLRTVEVTLVAPKSLVPSMVTTVPTGPLVGVNFVMPVHWA